MAQWHLAPGSFSWDAAAAALAGGRRPTPAVRHLAAAMPPRPTRARRRKFLSHEECLMTQKTPPEPGGARADGLSGPARQVHRAVLGAFARTGQPPGRGELEGLARGHGADPDAVLAELAGTDVLAFTTDGEIRAAYPFSPVATPIRVSWAGGPDADAMRAIDALGMSAMPGWPVTIAAAEPATGHVITVHAHGGRARWDPPTTVVFAGSAGDGRGPSADCACGCINFFATARAARARARRHREVVGRLLTQDAALRSGGAQLGTCCRPPRQARGRRARSRR
jgi:hypothetical protein